MLPGALQIRLASGGDSPQPMRRLHRLSRARQLRHAQSGRTLELCEAALRENGVRDEDGAAVVGLRHEQVRFEVRAKPRILRPAMADFCLQVIDNFFPDARAVRRQALATPIDVGGGNPGLTSANIDVERNMKHVGNLLKIKPDYAHLRHIVLFRMTRGSDAIRDTDIHVDGPCYAGVCYLNLPKQCSGGTSFFKHKRTGLETWPTRRQVNDLIASGRLPERVRREKDAILYWEEQGSDRSNWEQTLHVPMRFNRALFYNGNQFHSMSSWREFGDTKASARMTMVYFFHEE